MRLRLSLKGTETSYYYIDEGIANLLYYCAPKTEEQRHVQIDNSLSNIKRPVTTEALKGHNRIFSYFVVVSTFSSKHSSFVILALL